MFFFQFTMEDDTVKITPKTRITQLKLAFWLGVSVDDIKHLVEYATVTMFKYVIQKEKINVQQLEKFSRYLTVSHTLLVMIFIT